MDLGNDEQRIEFTFIVARDPSRTVHDLEVLMVEKLAEVLDVMRANLAAP